MAKKKKAAVRKPKASPKRVVRTRKAAAKRPRRPGPVADPLRTLAVIDVGSGALRMAISEAVRDKPLRRLDTLEVPLAIGLDTLSRGSIQASTTEVAIRTFRDFISVAESYGIRPSECRAVATTAVRDATNRDVFIARVEQGCGLKIEIIEAIEEIRLLYQAVRMSMGEQLQAGSWMLLNLGAGGTQIVVQRDGRVVFEETLNYGLLKLADLRGYERPNLLPVRAFLRKILHAVERVQDISGVRALVVVNTELRRLLLALARTRKGPAGLEVSRKELQRVHDRIADLHQDELVRSSELEAPIAERGRLALEELRVMLEATASRAAILPDISMMDSMLVDARLRTEVGEEGPLHDQVEAAARALGRKYRFDEAHGGHVRRMALELFDALAPIVHLPARSRLLLAVAATLHDIGYFISPRHHERHTAYLISASEIMGLRRGEVERVALIARCHRRPFAVVNGEEMERLPADERVEVLKLAALVRLCEALDQDHCQRIERLRVELSPERLHIYGVTRSGDRDAFASISHAFADKIDLFSEVFGVEPTLSEVLARRGRGPRSS